MSTCTPTPRAKLGQGYCYILMHPGTPTVFFDHWLDDELRQPIEELMNIRRRNNITSQVSESERGGCLWGGWGARHPPTHAESFGLST